MTTNPEYVIVRSRDAGCFAGTITDRAGDTVTLNGARRLWYWAGAATLSQLAMEGTSKPNECKFPAPVEHIVVLGVCEIIAVADTARASIEAVPVWRS